VSIERATDYAKYHKGLATDDVEDEDGIGWGDDPVYTPQPQAPPPTQPCIVSFPLKSSSIHGV